MAKSKIALIDQAKMEKKKLDLNKRVSKAEKSKTNFDRLHTILPTFLSLPPGKQENFINAKQFYKYCVGGFRSGKTEVLGAGLIWLAFENRPVPGLVISPTMTNVQMVVQEKLERLCERNGIGYEVFPSRYSGVIEFVMFFGNDKKDRGKILMSSPEAINSWIGLTVGFGGVDEPFRIKEDVIDAVASRVSDGGAKIPCIMFSGTPEPDLQNWGTDIVEIGEENSKERFVTRLSTRDNFHNRKGYVEDLLKKYDSATARNYIDGIPTLKKGDKVYYMFSEERNMVKERALNPKDRHSLMVIYDFNVNPMTALIGKIGKGYGEIIKDFLIESSNTWDITESILAYLNDFEKQNVSLIITGDRTSLKRDTRSHSVFNPVFDDYHIIRRMFDKAGWSYHMTLPDVNPEVRDRVQWVNNLFEKGLLRVWAGCTYVKEDMKFVVSKKGVNNFEKDKSKNPMRTHISDCVDYFAVLLRRMGIVGVDEELMRKEDVVYRDPRRTY